MCLDAVPDYSPIDSCTNTLNSSFPKTVQILANATFRFTVTYCWIQTLSCARQVLAKVSMSIPWASAESAERCRDEAAAAAWVAAAATVAWVAATCPRNRAFFILTLRWLIFLWGCFIEFISKNALSPSVGLCRQCLSSDALWICLRTSLLTSA